MCSVGLNLFAAHGSGWHDEDVPPRFAGCNFIRSRDRKAGEPRNGPKPPINSGLISVVLTFTGGYRIFVCWVGVELWEIDIGEKWRDRFPEYYNLGWYSKGLLMCGF